MIRIQPANTLNGEYDVKRPQPYPYFIEPNGDVGRQDVWNGDPAALIGFQRHAHVQVVELTNEEFQADPQRALGMFPVFVTSRGSLFSLQLPIESVKDMETSEGSEPKHTPGEAAPESGLSARLTLGTWSDYSGKFANARAEVHGFSTTQAAHEFRAKLPAYVQKFTYIRRWKGGVEQSGGFTFLFVEVNTWEKSTHKRLHRFVKAAQDAGARVEVAPHRDDTFYRSLGEPVATKADVLEFYGLTES